MQDVLNAMRREAERALANTAQPRMAIVTSYNPSDHTIKAKLQPENTETGWFPWASSMVGNGWGLFSPPSPGDQILVVFQEGSGGSPVGIGAIYNDVDRAVIEGLGGTPSGEVRLVNQSGARIRLLNDGTVEIRQQAGSQILMKPDGSIDINAPVVRVGALGATFRKLVNDTFMALFNTHVHANSPPPTQQMNATHLTTNLTGA